MQKTLWTTLLLATVAMAGCLGGDGDDGPDGPPPATPIASPEWAVRALYGDVHPGDTGNISDHDHSDRSLHQGLSTANFVVEGWTPLTTEHHGQSAGGYYCGEVSDAEEDGRRLAVVNSFTSAVAIAVIDVTVPSDPFLVGELVLPRTHIYDSAITDDGRFAILATSPLAAITHQDGSGAAIGAATLPSPIPEGLGAPTPTMATYTEAPVWRDACGNERQGPEDEIPYDSGTLLVDLGDPTVPAIADFVPAPAIGPHSVSSTTIDGVRYAASSITNLAYTASYFQFFTVEEVPLTGGKLVPTSSYTGHYTQNEQIAAGDPNAALLLNGHVDATIHQHPETGDLLGYLANWDGGLVTVDLSTPVATPVSTWGDLSTEAGARSGSIHTAYPIDGLRDGRFYVVTGQEVGGSFNEEGDRRPTGQVVVLDMTDPADPTPVARWTFPVYLQWSGALHFSTHYVAVEGDTLFVANYHGGVWAADLRESSWPELPSLGVFIPAHDPPGGAATDLAYTPSSLDVLALGDGRVLAFDSTSGAYALRFDDSLRDFPPAAPWTEDAWIE